jgi:hypothetical protein
MEPPQPLLTLFGSMLKQGAFIPDGFLFNYELNKIQINQYGAIAQPVGMREK